MTQRIIPPSVPVAKEPKKEVIAKLIPGSNEFGQGKGDQWGKPKAAVDEKDRKGVC